MTHDQQQSAAPERSSLRPAAYRNQAVEAGGIKLNLLDYGTAGKPALLCVHGSAAHAHWYDFVAGDLSAAGHHVRALDLRGHGDSEWGDPSQYSYPRFAADIDEVAQRLDLRDFVLIGHSMGGMCSLHYASAYRGRAKALIIVDTTFRMGDERIASFRNVGAREGSSYASQEEFAARFRPRPAGANAAPEIIRHLAKFSARPFADGRWRPKFDRNVYATRESYDGFALWGKITISALIVRGALSGRVTDDVFARVKSLCPQAELADVALADHHVTLDNPAGFVTAVQPWLARHR